MGKVSETIYSGDGAIIPMVDVSHIEKHWYPDDKRTKENYRGIQVVMKHTTWNQDMDGYNNAVYLVKEEADKFLRVYYHFKAELDSDILMNIP